MSNMQFIFYLNFLLLFFYVNIFDCFVTKFFLIKTFFFFFWIERFFSFSWIERLSPSLGLNDPSPFSDWTTLSPPRIGQPPLLDWMTPPLRSLFRLSWQRRTTFWLFENGRDESMVVYLSYNFEEDALFWQKRDFWKIFLGCTVCSLFWSKTMPGGYMRGTSVVKTAAGACSKLFRAARSLYPGRENGGLGCALSVTPIPVAAVW